MYGEKENSPLPRIFLAVSHFITILIAAWLMFGGGIETISNLFGFNWTSGDFTRRILLLSCAAVYLLRVLITVFVILRRKMDWSEAATIAVWVFFIHNFFALVGGTNSQPIGLLEIFGIILYIIGSFLNTGSETLRKIWKQNPENKGKIYTEGLFRYSMHVNYFGDFVLFTGYALITHSLYALIVPALMFCLFNFINIPMLDKYLAEKYGEEFEEYSRKTKKFVPFIY